MIEKFDFYDLMSSLIPGVLLVALVGTLFPNCCHHLVPDNNGTFAVLSLSALAIFVGQLLVAIGSMIEPLLFWTWGGKPSQASLTVGLGERYLPVSRAQTIKAKLLTQCEPDASTSGLFLKAMTLARQSETSLAERFNALYAYQRTLIVFVIVSLALAVVSRHHGLLHNLSTVNFSVILLILITVLVICWLRAKQRSLYFVREVLMSAETEIDTMQHCYKTDPASRR
jgi:hypothetical protein